MKVEIQLPENGYLFLGGIRPRSANEISGSNWTLGCETLDRDYADYNEYKEYIVPLGIKTIRLQAGWAKTERKPGIYDFSWLDEIIFDAVSRGLNILLETDYGNPIYSGGGGRDLGGGFPISDEALSAWDRWVETMALRYRDKVRDWAMWNEPDNDPKLPEASIARFNIRTAEIIKRVIPDARIGAFSLAIPDPWKMYRCSKAVRDAGKENLFTWIIYHGYLYNPDLFHLEELKSIAGMMLPHLKLRQGEQGCPSDPTERFALANHPWTEFSQAKWDLRRLLFDLGHDVESSIFTLCDFNHVGREINRKGLLRADENHKVIEPKLAYYAIQHLTAVFDDSLERIPSDDAVLVHRKQTNLFVYRKKPTGEFLINYWECEDVPSERNELESGEMVLRNMDLRDPVWCDLITGKIWEIPKASILRTDDLTVIRNVPVYDSPVILTEKSLLI